MEDLMSGDRRHITQKARKTLHWAKTRTQVTEPQKPHSQSPHSMYVKTWGCAHISSDGEYMAGQLAA